MKIYSAIAITFASLLGSAPLVAAEDPLAEITVTATRRVETLQTLASSATVFSNEDLHNLGVLEPRDLAEQTPGLLTKYGPNGLATVGFYMRGVGINDFTGTVDPSVGVYVDEVFKPTPDMLNFAVFDIERVEVLRGPQGTLYGRNSTGGAVNFLVAKPTAIFTGYVRGGYGSYRNASLQGALSGPLTTTLRGRLSMDVQNAPSDSGYSFNRFTNHKLGKNDSVAVRGQLQWLPGDSFKARLMYTYGDRKSAQPLLQHVAARDPANPGNICAPVIAGQRDEAACRDLLGYSDTGNRIYDGAANLDPLLKIQSNEVALSMEWKLARMTLTSITGYDDFTKRQSQDIDASPAVAADNNTQNNVKSFSQELRLASDSSFGFNWIVGANFGDTKIDWFQTINLTDLAGIPTSNGARQKTTASAIFGQAVIPFAEKFEFVAGLRYTNEKRDWTGATFIGDFGSLAEAYASGAPRLSQLPLPAGDPGAGGPLDFPTRVKKSKVDYQAVLKYRPTTDAMVYLSVSEAFRSGGYSSAVIFSQAALEPYKPETLRSVEGGLKLTFPSARMHLNLSAFHYDYKNFQATFVRGAEASARLQNAGDVKINGGELMLDWRPSDRWSFDLGASVLHTKIASTDVVLQPLDGGPAQTIEGNKIPNAPKLTLNGKARYEVPVSARYKAGFQIDFTSVGRHFLEPNNRAVLEEDGYSLLNGRVSFAPIDGPWQVSAWVKNASNQYYRSAAQDLALALGFSEIVNGQPRTWGGDFEYRF